MASLQDLFRRVLQRREEQLGAKHLQTLAAVRNLAKNLRSQQKFQEAEARHLMFRPDLPAHPQTNDILSLKLGFKKTVPQKIIVHLSKNSNWRQLKYHYSRMRSEGFSFYIWGPGG